METSAITIPPLKHRLVAWITTQPKFRAVLMVGSQARRDHPADAWSDLDLMLFATDFREYLTRTEWLDDLGQVWVCVPQQTGDGDPELLVLFEGGYKVDFVFYPLSELQQLVQAETLPDVYRRGYEVLVDKDGLTAGLPACPFEPDPIVPPRAETFLATLNAFWYGAVYVAKQIRRRQLWLVKYRDWTMKTHLLRVMEWHARAVNGWAYDTWHDGKFVAEWTDPQTWAALDHVFGHFDAADSWQALLATMDLFRRLAEETAKHLGYPYPVLLDERVTQFVNQLQREDITLP